MVLSWVQLCTPLLLFFGLLIVTKFLLLTCFNVTDSILFENCFTFYASFSLFIFFVDPLTRRM